MKIIKLKSLNINSLKGEFEIDFEKFLKDESLFAITGPTGAGKSTILDIITCALYGRTARLSNPNELMSRNTGEALCEVEFEIKGKNYLSSWSQKRARKSADGNFQTAKMEVVDLSTNKILESKLRLVPKVIEELSGLDFDRFIQSMMLAQGSFDAFLKAKENERSTLLENITGTHIYKQISLSIYETYSNHKKAIELEENSLGNIELLEKDVLEEKTKLLEESNKGKKELDKKEFELKKIALYLENLQKLELANINFTQDYEKISKEKEEKKEDFKNLALASKAIQIQPINQEKNQTASSIKIDKENLNALQEEIEELKVIFESKKEESSFIKEQFDNEKISFEENSQKLKTIRDINSQIKNQTQTNQNINIKLQKQIKELAIYFKVDENLLFENESLIEQYTQKQEEELKSIFDELEKIQNEYKKLDEKTVNLSQKEQELRAKLKQIEELLNSSDEYKIINENIQKEELLSKELEKEIKNQSDLNIIKSKLITQIEQTLQTLKEKRDRELQIKKYEDDRLKLKDNEECFLCGSKEHPYINHALDLNIDETSKKIKEEESKLNQESNELKNSEINLAKLNSKLESSVQELEKQNILKSKTEELFVRLNFTYEENSKIVLNEQKEQIENELKEIVLLRDEKEKLSQKKENLQKRYSDFKETILRIESLKSSLNELKKEQNILDKEIIELKKEAKNILDIENLEQFEQNISKKFTLIQDKYNAIEKELVSLKSKDESLNKQIEQLKIKQKTENIKLESLNKKFDQALEEYEFSSKEEFEKALLNRYELELLSNTCKTIEEKYTQAITLKNDTAKKLKEQKELNLSSRKIEDVNIELNELQTTIDELQKSIGSLEKELEINAQNIKKHEDKIKELEKKKEAFKVWVKLNEMIGSATGDKFAKFAQGITLDQLIYLANKHLKILSPRYELQRSLDSNKLLEIEICDGFQGDVIRGVNTLSGGESFIVSLSLALGLSSLASQKISIDSLFLDEGFGTLDSESLELALNALNQLQVSGKMVGVISHVEALKERIPLQIRVVPKGDGTSLLQLL